MNPARATLQTDLRYALGFFALAAAFGLVLRSYPLFEIPFTYKYLVHAHSHLVLLGWVYLALQALIVSQWLPHVALSRAYRLIRTGVLVSLAGMLCTFPIMGYAPASIFFSTLFLFVSYAFLAFFLKHASREARHMPSYRLVRAGLWYMAASSLGPWALGAIMATLGPASIWYRMAVYFYLHFQYNGWMLMALAGLFLLLYEQNGSVLPESIFRPLFRLLHAGVILTFLLSTLWAGPPLAVHGVGALGALLQLVALGWLATWLSGQPLPAGLNPAARTMALTALALLAVKVLLQLLSALPGFTRLAVSFPDFILAYLHGTFLGVIGLLLFTLMAVWGLLNMGRAWLVLYLAGFAATEALLVYRGLCGWFGILPFAGTQEALWAGSLLLFAAVLWAWICSLQAATKP